MSRVAVEVAQDWYYEAKARGVTDSVIAERLGWRDVNDRLEVGRVRRMIGILGHPHEGELQQMKTISEDFALRFAEALGLDPVDIDL
jgi:hypothetical protein